MIRFILVAILAIGLAGCAGQSVLQGGSSLTATVANPVSLTTAYDIEAAVAGVRRIGLEAMRTRQCRRSEAVKATNICVRRSVKVEIQNADARLIQVLKPFRVFVRDNPNVSVVSVAGDVYKAIKEYQAALYVNNIAGVQ